MTQDGLEEGIKAAVDVVPNDTIAVLQKAEIDQQIATAHAYPRSIKGFRTDAMAMATMDSEVAEECMFSLPRGGKVIQGPSVRMAEIVAHTFGNCRAGSRIVDEDDKFIIAQGIFHDLEKNVAITCEIRRRITDKNGKKFKDDMIAVTANAACSIALRNAVFKGVPKAMWSNVYKAARLVAIGEASDLMTRIHKMFGEFMHYGVQEPDILLALEIEEVEKLTQDHLILLIGYFNAIKNGEADIETIFPKQTEHDKNLKQFAKKPVEATGCAEASPQDHPEEKAPVSEPHQAPTGEVTIDDDDIPQ